MIQLCPYMVPDTQSENCSLSATEYKHTVIIRKGGRGEEGSGGEKRGRERGEVGQGREGEEG